MAILDMVSDNHHENVREILIKALRDPSPRIRVLAVQSLHTVRLTRPEKSYILRMSWNDPEERVRSAALQHVWLGGFDGSRVANEEFAAVFHALSDNSTHIREVALDKVVQILGRNGPQQLLIFQTSNSERTARAEQAAQLWQSPKLAERVFSLAQDQRFKDFAIRALAAMGDKRALEPLLEQVKNEEPWSRRLAEEALGWTGDRKALDPLLSAAKKSDIVEEEYGTIMVSLARLGFPEGVALVADFLQGTSSDVNGRSTVARELMNSKDQQVIEAIFAAIYNPDQPSMIRGNYLYPATVLDAKRAYVAAVSILQRRADKPIYWQAVLALERIGDKRAIPILESVIADDPTLERLVKHAIEVLRKR